MIPGLVSVVVPTYNRAYCLEATIDSVLAQTYPNFEVVVIDDGSSDNTHLLFEGRYANDARIKYYPQPNGGLPAARNAGIKRSQGEYIAFCDSDDIWLPHKLAVQVACLKKFPEVGLVWTDLSAVDPDGKELFARYTRVGYKTWGMFTMDEIFSKSARLSDIDPTLTVDGDVHVGDVFTAMVQGAIINIPTVIVSRERIDQVGLFNETMRVGEDYDFDLRVCLAGAVAFADVVTVAYRVGAPDQLTRPEFLVDQARNSLRTLEPIVASHRDRIKMSDDRLNGVMAGRFTWLAHSEFDMGNRAASRTAALRSLRLRPKQPRLIAMTLAGLLPTSAIAALRRGYQRIKAR